MPEAFDHYRKWLGIPPQEQPPNQYRLLGIAVFEDDPDVIENAANRQMAHVRTFQAGRHGALSQQLLNELSAARICLLDPDKKQAYDEQLRRSLEQRGVTGTAVDGPGAAEPGGAEPAGGESRGATPPGLPTVRPGGGVTTPRKRSRTGTRGTVAAARGNSPVVASRGRSVAAARQVRRRSSPLPVVLALIAGAVVIGGVIVAMNGDWGGEEPSGASRDADRGRSTKPSGLLHDARRGPLRRLKPDDRSVASGGSGVVGRSSDAGAGFSGDSVPGFPGTVVTPGDERNRDERNGDERRSSFSGMTVREQIFAEAMEAARMALADRKLNEVSGHLERARTTKPDDDQLALWNRLQAIKTYVTNFWNGVRRGIGETLKEEQSFEYAGESYRVLSYEEDTVKFTAADHEVESKVSELDLDHARAFATAGLSADDPFTKVYVAAVLVTDRQARGDARRADEARRLLREGALLAGRPDVNQFVAEELGDDPAAPLIEQPEMNPSERKTPDASPEGEPGTTGEAPSEPAGGKTRNAVPADDSLSDARRQVVERYDADFEQIRRDREHRGPFARKLVDDSRKQSDAALRYAMLTEACDQAVKACDADVLKAATDELVGYFDREPLQCRVDYWIEYARQRDADGQVVMDVASEMRESALADERLELAIELLDLGMRGAKKAQDDEAYRKLNIEQQQLKARLNDLKRDSS